jgi:hypothetical protein
MKVDTSKLKLLPVPEGLRIKYHHIYDDAGTGLFPPKLIGTRAWLETTDHIALQNSEAYAWVNPKDTPIKKLGRTIAHNRCIKEYLKANG